MKPYVICHMMPSLDGRLRTERWKIPDAAHQEYDRTADTYRAQAWLCGRVTMEEFAGGRWHPPRGRRSGGRVPPGDWLSPRRGKRFAVALDSGGKLAWEGPAVEGDSIITVLSETVPAAYLAYLRDRGVSYLFGGRRGELNLKATVAKLREKFGITRLLVEGGGKTTGAFLRAGLIDELSLLLTPVADGRMNEPALFDTEGNRAPKALANVRILSVRKIGAGMFWLKARPLNRQ
jgi:2,5-diamino-6-(ribosylamino)-4(3H)-pyrimidinone 5'-phosphate reductase